MSSARLLCQQRPAQLCSALDGWHPGRVGTRQVPLLRRYRMRELVTAHGLLATMGEGRLLQGLSLGSGLDARSAFAGRLQMGCVALMGHSYGGASVAGLTAEDGRFACGIALDPWWCASCHVCPEAARGRSMRTQIPLSLSILGTDL